MCYRVLKASAIRPLERSLRFTIENTPSMSFNDRAHAEIESSSSPIALVKAQTQEEW